MFGINRKIFYWSLYDLANSIIISNLTLYFSQWLIVDNSYPDIWYGSAVALATLLLLFTAPVVGISSDHSHKKMAYILPLSLVFGVGTICLGFFTISSLPILVRVMGALVFFVILQYAYQLSLVFYDTLLAEIADPKDYGRVSGFGEAMGNLGQIIGLFITYPLISRNITLLGEAGRAQAFIPAGICFLILAAPMLANFKDKKVNQKYTPPSIKETLKSIKNMLSNHNILWFLVAFYFISDVILTIQIFFPIYFEQVLGFSDFDKIVATILILIFIITGALILGKFSDRVGFKRMTSITTIVLMFLFSMFPFIKNASTIWFLLPFAGFFWGGFYSATRALLTKLSPPDKIAEFFSLYTIFRRSASILGPMVWSFTVLLFSDAGVDKYRYSIYPLMAFMVIGFGLLTKVRADSPTK